MTTATPPAMTPAPADNEPIFEGGETSITPRQARQLHAAVHIDAQARQGRLHRLERYNNMFGPRWGLLGDKDLAFLKPMRTHIFKVWLAVGRDETQRSATDAYVQQASDLCDELLVNLGGHGLISKEGMSHAAFEECVYQTIDRLVRMFPKVRYVEALNEYEGTDGKSWTTQTMDEYARLYELFAHAVDRVNADRLPKEQVMLGGPVTCTFSESSLGTVLNYLADKQLRLDFVSYHQYLFGSFRGKPSRVKHETEIVRSMLRRRDLRDDVPIFVTETGVFPQGPNAGTTDREADIVTQAPAMLAKGYQYMEAGPGHAVPFQWVVRHGQNSRKNQLARGRDGVPTPYGNALRALSMLHDTRIKAQSDALSQDGQGVAALAGVEGENKLAVLVWNYQWIDGRDSYEVTLPMSGLPAGGWRLQRYLIDRAHSNYRATPDQPGLAMVEESSVQAVEGRLVIRQALGVNAVALLMLERL